MIHYSLVLPSTWSRDWKGLDTLLELGGSVWQATDKGLVDRVDPTAMQAFNTVTAIQTLPATNCEAWSNAHGRNPDPSDAWDHSIKSVEAALRPIVCPNNTAATLSNVIGELRSQPWRLNVRGRARDYIVEPLIKMLELMWPDPNRHGAATPEPPATLAEARAVVHVAVTVVQWARDSQIVRR